ncbi:TIGR00366 family protein [Bacillus piscicola]|uniref:TIGR00366 family protein n=1 Tax=Bacillus piscicola TaxID=1632684 RepID=UPI0030843E63
MLFLLLKLYFSSVYCYQIYWAAGFINILSPSGGGQWELQGPLQVLVVLQLGVDSSLTAMTAREMFGRT